MLMILDTNILSLMQRRVQPPTDRITARLCLVPPQDQWTTIVTFQEQTKGWLAAIHHARNESQLLAGYRSLLEMLDDFRKLKVFPFDKDALAIFRELKAKHLGVGTRDLRIASIALARGAKVITQNLKDFEKVPGLSAEDWTV
ncbi:MAG: PIN domain-containing protein [Planctomycetaceae bacterium]|nr:PIN domain-containing protein [Planctomycetaceae bacterium]